MVAGPERVVTLVTVRVLDKAVPERTARVAENPTAPETWSVPLSTAEVVNRPLSTEACWFNATIA